MSTALKSSTETLGELKVEQIDDSDFDFGGWEEKSTDVSSLDVIDASGNQK